MSSKNKTELIAEKGKQEMFIIREFDAPRELVYRAFTDSEILKQFFAPKGVTMNFYHANYKTGGSYRFQHSRNGEVLCTFNGVVHEACFPERVIQTSEMEEIPERGHVVLEIMTFEELPGNRTKLTFQDICRSVADRDAMIQSGMEGGLIEIFENLDTLFSKELITN